jgi:hypothetical protein
MTSSTYEGTVVNGKIQLPADVQLPENARVLVTVPDATEALQRHLHSPRLVHPGQAKDFEMEVEKTPDASL